MLELVGVESGYGETLILHDVHLSVCAGCVHAVLGRNGAGKSTMLKTIIGQLPTRQGVIRFGGRDISNLPPNQRAKLGIAYVPETRDIFGALSVRENLQLAARLAPPNQGRNPKGWNIDEVLDFFPQLAARLNHSGHQLSGGEQQMLAIGRAMMMAPALLILDEPTEGLAPLLIEQILQKLTALKAQDITILLVEQNLHFASALADEISLMGRGQIVWHGTAAALHKDTKAQANWLGV